ncbi:MAG: AraC family transcriptional regulator [Planctomycetota bacterium]
MRPWQVILGRVDYPPGGRFGPRTQGDLQIVMIDRGSLALTVDGSERLDIAPGELVVQWPGMREVYRFDRKQWTTHRWIALSYDDKPATQRWLREAQRRSPRTVIETDAMRRLFETGFALGGAAMGHVAEAYLACVLGTIDADGDLAEARPGRNPHPPVLAEALAYIDTNLHEAIELADLADAASVTAPHLVRLFRKELGVTPIALLWQRRVERARGLLSDTGLSVSEIGYAVGFTSPHHFSRKFREIVGRSPKAFREQAWQA